MYTLTLEFETKEEAEACLAHLQTAEANTAAEKVGSGFYDSKIEEVK